MIFVGIDVAKDKHDCFISNSDGEVLYKVFTITNNLEGFHDLYQKISSVMVSSLNKSIQKHNNLMDCQPYVLIKV